MRTVCGGWTCLVWGSMGVTMVVSLSEVVFVDGDDGVGAVVCSKL